MSDNKYKIEYASTGRATCKDKDCKQTIGKGELRIGKIGKNPFGDEGDTKTDWFHAKCVFNALTRARAGTKRIESTADIEGFDDVKDADKDKVKGYVKGEGVSAGVKAKGKGKAKSKDKTKAKGTKRKKSSSSSSSSEGEGDGSDDEKKPKRKKKPTKKKAEADEEAGSDEDKPKKKKKAAPKKKAKGSDDEGEGSDDERPKKKAKSEPKKKSGDGGGGGGGGNTRHFEMDSKFWEITVNGDQISTRWGKIDSNGQSKEETAGSAEKAQKKADTLIKSKVKKGYAEQSK